MRRKKLILILSSLAILIFVLASCGGFEMWVEVEFSLPVIEFTLGLLAPNMNEISLADDEHFIGLGGYEVGLNDEAKESLGGRQITDLEISVDWQVEGLGDPVHVRVYMTSEEKTSDQITDDELFWEGDLTNGEASETIRKSNCPALQNVIIPILNSENRSGTIHVYLVHNYEGIGQVNGSLSIKVKKVKVKVF